MLAVGLCVAYGKLAWSCLLAVEIWFGLFLLTLDNRLVSFTYGSPVLELHVVLFTCGFPTASKKDEP